MGITKFILFFRRIKALRLLLADKEASLVKKSLVIFGLIYLFLPYDLIPPILGPLGFIDDAVLWAYIIWYLKDELDEYQDKAEKKTEDSKKYKDKTVVEGATFTVDDKEKK